METILVTGGAGYIGSITVRRLLEKGYKVVIIDDLSRGNKAALPKNVPFIQSSVCNDKLILETIKKHNITAVIHFASYAYVGESVDEPSLYFDKNLRESLMLLEAIRKSKVRKIIFSSSCAIYGIPEKLPITENEKRSPINPYGLTKILFERALQTYEYSYGIKHVIFRYFNVGGAAYEIGEEHHPETHLIPIILEVAQGKRESINIYGDDYQTPDGTCIRDYIHVLDIADAHIMALEYLDKQDSNCFNLGTGNGTSNKEMIKICEEVTGKKIKVVYSARRPGDPPILFASAEKAKKELGWVPKYSIHEIIRDAWDWHRKNPEGYKKS